MEYAVPARKNSRYISRARLTQYTNEGVTSVGNLGPRILTCSTTAAGGPTFVRSFVLSSKPQSPPHSKNNTEKRPRTDGLVGRTSSSSFCSKGLSSPSQLLPTSSSSGSEFSQHHHIPLSLSLPHAYSPSFLPLPTLNLIESAHSNALFSLSLNPDLSYTTLDMHAASPVSKGYSSFYVVDKFFPL